MLFHTLMKTAQDYSGKTALVVGERHISYGELLLLVKQLINRLRSLMIDEGDCIALVLPNSVEFVVSFFAVAGVRAIVLPLNPNLKARELHYYLSDNAVKAIITNSQRLELCQHAVNELDQEIPLLLADASGERIERPQSHPPSRSVQDTFQTPFEGPVIYQYSSGSTGRAKKVCRTQRNLAFETGAYVSGTHMTAVDNVLCVVPLFHAHGLGKCLLACIATGATLVILEQVVQDGRAVEVPFVWRTKRVLELLMQQHISILPATPYIFGALAETPAEVYVDVSSLRLCLSGGNFLPEEIFRGFKQRFGIPLRSIYGSTETGSVALNMEPEEQVRYDSVGRPSGSVEVRITNGTTQEVPVGRIGEVAVKSQAMTTGYLNMPELTREAFRDGFFFTGDLGKKDEQGLLYITGRKKIFIESSGEKVDPLEIEEVLKTHSAVSEAVVVGIAGPYGGQAIKAVVVSKGELTELELLLYCRERLSDYKVPRMVEFREMLPKSPLGKVLRNDLLDGPGLASEADLSPKRDNALRTKLLTLREGEETSEQFLGMQICKQLAEMLKVNVVEIDVHRPLGEFGLGSLMAVELRNWLEASLGLTLPVTIFWSYPTVAALASYLISTLRKVLNTALPSPTEALHPSEASEPESGMLRTLAAIEHLSDAEVQQQIDALTREIWSGGMIGDAGRGDTLSSLPQIEQLSDDEVQQLLFQEIVESGEQAE